MKKYLLLVLVALSNATVNAQTADQLLERALAEKHELLEHLSEFKLQREVQNGHLGVRHLYFQQAYAGVSIRHAVADLHVNQQGEMVAFHESFIAHQLRASDCSPLISAGDAFHSAAEHLEFGYESRFGEQLFKMNEQGVWILKDASLSSEAITARPEFILVDKELKLHWKIHWHFPAGAHVYSIYIDANDGVVTELVDEVISCNFGPHAHAPKSTTVPRGMFALEGAKTAANPSYRVLPIPFESPNHGSFSLLSDPSDSLSSPFGWHDINGTAGEEYTITRGNNVYSREDKDANNTGGYSPDGGSSLVFDYPYKNEKRDALYEDAAITNLFYMNNIMHDVWYHYGFDEESGNFQQNNYGRGGVDAKGADFVVAEARDGSGTNNANFFTPNDGQSGRMQMFLWTTNAASDLLHVLSPPAAEGDYAAANAAFGPQLSTTPIQADLVEVNDGTANANRGCSALQNAAQVKGKIALVERGGCNFTVKVQNAQDAGAIAVIVVNNQAGSPITMGGSSSSINIPSIHIAQDDGTKILDVMTKEVVRASLYDSSSVNNIVFGSDFDNGIIAHEYGHGISNRLTGGPLNSSCLQNQEQAGEGWSDFFTLVMTHRPTDQPDAPRGIGTYVRNQPTSGGGIRPYPYTRNMSVNPATYDNIKTFSVPHGVGSVWCSMLWDMYWNMIDEYGYDPDIYEGEGGNNMAMQLVMDGLKLQPCNPGFTDSRDAILLADRLRYGGKNQKLIWETFARRGLGLGADQGSTNSRSDGVQAFDVPTWLENQIYVEKYAPERVPAGTFFSYRIKGTNLTLQTQYDIVLTDTLDPALSVNESSLPPSVVWQNGVIRMTADSLLSGDSMIMEFEVAVMNPTTYSVLSFVDDMEADSSSWQVLSENGSNSWSIDTFLAYSGKQSWFVQNIGTQSDQSLVHEFVLNGEKPAMVFHHWFDTEDGWDGGVLEIRVKGSSIWNDASSLFIHGGYNQQIQTNPASNISDRKAFSGKSNGWLKSVLSLETYKGKEVELRFRFVSDGAQDGVGWYIDDVELVDELYAINNIAHSSGRDMKVKSSNEVFTMIDLNEALGMQDLYASLHLQLYPNPFREQIHVFSGQNAPLNYELMDMLGKTVLNGELKQGLNTIATSNLPAGTYIFRAGHEKGQEVLKLIKW